MTKKQRRLASKIEQSLACAKATAAALQNAKPASAYAHHEADSAEPALAEVKQADSEKKNRRFGNGLNIPVTDVQRNLCEPQVS